MLHEYRVCKSLTEVLRTFYKKAPQSTTKRYSQTSGFDGVVSIISMEHSKWQGWFSSKSVIINIKFSIFNDTLFLSTEKIKLECEFLYSKYGKLSDSQFSAKKI